MSVNRKHEDIRPSALKKVVSKELSPFAGYEQHDAQEFLTYFLDKLSEDLNRNVKEEKKELAPPIPQIPSGSSENVGDGGTGGLPRADPVQSMQENESNGKPSSAKPEMPVP